MGLRGPAPKAHRTKPIQFTPGVRPAPEWLDEGGRKVYKRVTETLADILQQPDEATVAIYSQAVADVGRLTKEIRDEGEVVKGYRGQLVRNPKNTILKSALETMLKAGAKLGVSPMDRKRLPTSIKREGFNEFANF